MATDPKDPTTPPPLDPLPTNVADPTFVLPSGTRPIKDNRYQRGKRKFITGDPKFKANGKRISAEQYEAIWEAWRDGNRGKSKLAALFSLAWSTIDVLVKRGYPDRGFPAFIDRLKLWEAAAASAKIATIEDKKKRADEEWEKATQEHLKLSNATRFGLAQLIRKAVEATARVEFTRTRKRRVLDKAGTVQVIDEEVPISAVTMAEVWKTIVQSVETVGKIESFWRGGPTSRSEIMGSAVSALHAFQKLTPEQLDYIISSGGDLPPGVTSEDLFGIIGNGQGPGDN